MDSSLYETLLREVSELELENARLFCAYKENELLLAKKRYEMNMAMLASGFGSAYESLPFEPLFTLKEEDK